MKPFAARPWLALRFASLIGGLLGSGQPLGAAQVHFWGNACCGQDQAPTTSELIELAGGDVFGAGLRSDGTVVAWGSNFNNETNVPPGLSDVIAIACGSSHTLGLSSAGSVRAWGSNLLGETDVPTGLFSAVAISAGGFFNLALQSDGTVVGWGDPGSPSSPIPLGLENVVGISVGLTHSLALRADGRVVAWGGNASGQAKVPANLTNAVVIAAGWSHSLAVTSEGRVVAWGSGEGTNVPPELGPVASVCAGEQFSVALLRNGTVRAWGAESEGRTNVPPGLSNIVSVAAGGTFAFALEGSGPPVVTSSSLGRTAAWGLPVYFAASASGAFPLHFQWTFQGEDLPGETNAVLAIPSVRAEQEGIYAIRVSNAQGETTGVPMFLNIAPLLLLRGPGAVTAFWDSAAVFDVEVVSGVPVRFQWQFNGRDLAGETNRVLRVPAVRFAQCGRYGVVVSNDRGQVRSADAQLTLSQVFAWGDDSAGQCHPPPQALNLVDVSAGRGHGVALQADGRVVIWGSLDLGSNPVPENPGRLVAVSAGSTHDLALRDDGSVLGWGANNTGQLNIPAGLSNVVKVVAGASCSMALRSDGTVALWGGNSSLTSVPALLRNVVDIALADANALALRADGAIVVWGTGARLAAVPSGLTHAIALTAAHDVAAAVTSEGQIVVWGSSTLTNPPPAFPQVWQTSLGITHGLALDPTRTVRTWGTGYYGETEVPAALGVVAKVAAGDGFSLALAAAGPPFLGPPGASREVPAGLDAYLVGMATGESPLSYVWKLGDEIVPGAEGPILRLSSVRPEQAGTYTVIVRNALGAATNRVSLAVPPLLITSPPQDQQVVPGSAVTFEVQASSGLTLDYQWMLEGSPISGATNRTFTLTNVQPESAGRYAVRVSNALGSVTSSPAQLTLTMVLAWGGNNFGQIKVPAHLTNVLEIACGDDHTLAVTADGRVVAWGSNVAGQCSVPAGLSQVVAVAAGQSHSLALRSDGTVVAWGSNLQGQASVPSGLAQVVAIAAGASHSLALRADGSVVGWGLNRNGQSSPPAYLREAVAIAAGTTGSLALRSDGTLVPWGAFNQRVFPPGKETPLPTNVVTVASHGLQQMALIAGGKVSTWGGSGDLYAVPTGLSNVVSVAPGAAHLMALMAGGAPMAWGRLTGSIGINLSLPAGMPPLAALAAGTNHSVALVALGAPRITRLSPHGTAVPGRSAFLYAQAVGAQPLTYQWQYRGVDIPGARQPFLTLTQFSPDRAGEYSVVVSNTFGVVTSPAVQLGVAPAYLTTSLTNQNTFQGGLVRFQAAASGPGPLSYQWQRDGLDIAGATSATLTLAGIKLAQAGEYRVRVSNSYGSITSNPAKLQVSELAAWGPSSWGQTNVPAGLVGVQAISLGFSHALALKTDGTVSAWGNGVGVPTGMTRLIRVVAGASHDLGILEDGTPIAWGDNTSGQTNIPAGLGKVVEILPVNSVSLAVDPSGRVHAWGDASDAIGQVPSDATNVVTLSAGWDHVLALRRDGTVVAWGNDEAGQLEVPGSLESVVKVLAAGDLCLALRADGTVAAWGAWPDGPGPVPSQLRDVVDVASVGSHSLALLRNGQVVAWGDNSCGQTNVPAGLLDVVAVAVDSCVSFAVRGDGRLVAWGGGMLASSGMVSMMSNIQSLQTSYGNILVQMGEAPAPRWVPLAQPGFDGATFLFRFRVARGGVYEVQQTGTVDSAEWGHRPMKMGEGVDSEWKVHPGASATEFFRVRKWSESAPRRTP